ncbi:VWFA domain-containing protein [Entamoeba marina]
MFFVVLITLSIALDCGEFIQQQSYTPQEAFECINSITTTEDFNTKLVDSLKTLFESYVYKDILKNPPQPEGYDNYHYSVNIDDRLEQINLKETSMYSLYQQIKSIVFDAHDLHLSFALHSSESQNYQFDSFYSALPFQIQIKNEGKDVYFEPYTSVSLYGVDIPEEIQNNVNVSLQTVNGMTPLEWIRDYATKFMGLKSPHGRFTYAIESMSLVSLVSTPFEEEFLNTPIEVVYSNGDELTLNYSILYIPPSSISAEKLQLIKDKNLNKIMKPLNANDLSDTYKQEELSDVSFDFTSKDKNLACKTYDTDDKKINVLILTTFAPSTLYFTDFMNTFENCVNLFDSNSYPITVILPMNGGGYVDLEANVENILAPEADTKIIASVRISEGTENCLRNSYSTSFSNLTTCELRSNYFGYTKMGDWYDKPITDSYGDYKHTRTQPSLSNPTDMVTGRLFKHPRKPTDVVVFTDGFCYSACSMLAKGLSEKGNAIVVGFEGDPEGDLNLFDAGQSPTFVISSVDTKLKEADYLQSIGGAMQISFVETYRFNYNYDETIPREFLLNPVNERVHIYRYTPSKVDQFTDIALEMVEKYQTECDFCIKKLYENSDVKHAYDGYLCGNDGKWTDNTVASYCDPGYQMDFNTRTCIVDVCSTWPAENEEDSESSEDSEKISGLSSTEKYITLAVVIVCWILSLVIAVVISVLLSVFIISKKNKKSEYGTL